MVGQSFVLEMIEYIYIVHRTVSSKIPRTSILRTVSIYFKCSLSFLNAVSVNPQMENELEHVRSSLQDASQQISDLKMQQTIMTSGVTVTYFELAYSLCSQRRAFA